MDEKFTCALLSKVNVKAGLLGLSTLLCAAGLYLCVEGIQSTGSIDLKAAVVEGRISTESLGLLVLFLAVLPAVAATYLSRQEKQIELTFGDRKVRVRNMSESEWSH